jgi:hypothetical protein
MRPRSRKEKNLLTECDLVKKKRTADLLFIRRKLQTVYTFIEEQPRQKIKTLKPKQFDEAARSIREILLRELEVKRPEYLRMVQIVNEIIDMRITHELAGLRNFLALFLKEYVLLANVKLEEYGEGQHFVYKAH